VGGATQQAALFNGVANGDAAGDIISNTIENLTGSAFNDSLTGNQFDNTIRSGSGNDILRGGNGADILVVEGTGTKQLFGDGVSGEPAGTPPDGIDTYVVAPDAVGLGIIRDYTFNSDPALAEDIVLATAPTQIVQGTVGGLAALILDGATFDMAVLLNGTSFATALAIINANLTIDPDFLA
jgi:Ca2+-binding RTX toxin-like protein